MKNQQRGTPKKKFPALLQIDNYQKLVQYADENKVTLARALNDMIRAYDSGITS